MSASAHGFEVRSGSGGTGRSPAGWREGSPGRLARTAFLAAVAGLGLAIFEQLAGTAGAARGAALPAAAGCPQQDTGLRLRLPPGHPPVPGYESVAPSLPPGHPPVGSGPGVPLFPQDAPRTL